jgi:hypothetical protein
MANFTFHAPQLQRSSSRLDRRIGWIILILTLATYAYIFQGLGWNQMSHFGTIRSIVERGTADISPFAGDTQDTMVLGARLYSNKPPGVPLLGIPIYFVLIHVERIFGVDFTAPAVWLRNLHAMTVLLCALPGAVLNVLLYFAFRREGLTPRASTLLAGGFAFGSLSLPYSGLFMSHMLCSLLVFAAWYKLTSPDLQPRDAVLAGAMIGYCNLCDLLTVVVTASLGIYLIVRRSDVRYWVGYAIGPCAALLALLLYDRLAYGSGTTVSQFHGRNFTQPGLLFGQFDWPDIRRIYWITYQPMRGLFACCPEFVLCLFAPLLMLREKAFEPRLDRLVMLPMLAGYLLFYMTFYGWNGGYAIGPRYLIPILPLLWMFVSRPFQKMPGICGIVIAISMICMLAVTSVCPVDPEKDHGPPTANDPVNVDLIVFIHGRVNDAYGCETLGGLLGVPKRFLIIPFLLSVAVYFCVPAFLPRKPEGV